MSRTILSLLLLTFVANSPISAKIWNIKDEYLKKFSGGVKSDASKVLWDSLVTEFQPGDVVDLRNDERPIFFKDENGNKYYPPKYDFINPETGHAENRYAFDFSNSCDSLVIYAKKAPAALGGGSQWHRVRGSMVPLPGGIKNCFIMFPGKMNLGSGGYDNVVVLDAGGFGSGQFRMKDFKNSKLIYWDCNSNYNYDLKFVRLYGDFTNSLLINSIQTNYCNKEISCILDGVKGATLLGGDNERAAGINWMLSDCEDVRMIGIRAFTSAGSANAPICNTITYAPVFYVTGGKNNKFVFSQDIMDFPLSLHVDQSHNFMHWGGSWAHDDSIDEESMSSALLCFFTPNVFGETPIGLFGEPVDVENEVIFTYKNEDLTQGDAQRLEVPVPPSIPPVHSDWSLDFPIPHAESEWGQKLLDAGADPTGQELSDDAFAAVLDDNGGNVNVPAGTFKISRPLVAGRVCGYGRDKSIIKMTDPSEPVIRRDGGGDICDLTLEGGKYGIEVFQYRAGVKTYNLTIKNSAIAGIKGGSDEFYITAEAEYDQQRYYNIHFINTGKFGIQVNNGMVDKNQFYKCVFKGQSEAGISYPNTHMFAGAITECYFEDIDGPAIDFHPRDASQLSSGYTPHCSTIEGCTIIECGNAEEPAVDWSWMESGSVSNTLIQIQDKPWKYGFRGTGQYMFNVTIDVNESNMVEGGAALALRHTRQVLNARPTGNILKKVHATGPFMLINDTPEELRLPNPSYLGEWAYPHLLYDCSFTNRDHSLGSSNPMVLLKADINANIVDEIELSPMEDEDPPVTVKPSLRTAPIRRNPEAISVIYDVRGRMIARGKGDIYKSQRRRLSRGVYISRTGTVRKLKLNAR
ncbi:MAG: hypothetical protein GF344_10140 [Chitinivibrionales bacterium]|nr:hypothetical protein [Chitinivibrionales bacterium]MBD3357194.1 hypothetical protein [Chitinivibrionales bacterium]